ncbi:phage portal protein [Micromonospora sp. SCSIO 07396]
MRPGDALVRRPPGLLERISAVRRPARSISTVDDYLGALNEFVFQGNTYPLGGGVQQTLAGERAERIPNSLEGYATAAYQANGVVFACMAVRMLVFSAVRFQFQAFNRGRPSVMFGGRELELLERPWAGGTTQDLLTQMIQDADLAGNSFWTEHDGELVRMRPDWVEIVLAPRRLRGGQLGWTRMGYRYTEGGTGSGAEPVILLPDEVAHFAPIPDPLATFRGMSWLTPVVREIQADGLMVQHKRRFFENGATPNMVVTGITAANQTEFDAIIDMLEANHAGVANAYRTLYLAAGADAKVVGADLKQIEFATVQGRGETRIAAAAGVHPVIVGLSEGLQGSSLNAGNYGQARRRFADGTMHPLWQNAAGSLEQLVAPPGPATRLWYDARDVPFLREDRKDAAEIQQTKAQTIRTYVDAGFTPESAVAAVAAEDDGLLVHTGLFSVQLQPANTQPALPAQAEGE